MVWHDMRERAYNSKGGVGMAEWAETHNTGVDWHILAAKVLLKAGSNYY